MVDGGIYIDTRSVAFLHFNFEVVLLNVKKSRKTKNLLQTVFCNHTSLVVCSTRKDFPTAYIHQLA